MSGYGTHKWTCGECGDSYEASGVVSDLNVSRWEREHKEGHRVEKMSADERDAYWRHLQATQLLAFKMDMSVDE